MKKILTLLALTTCINVHAQITLEHIYTGSSNDHNAAFPTYLDGIGFKYYQNYCYINKLYIYNLNHTLYKTIDVPYLIPTYFNEFMINYVTTNLFDNDSSTIEYLWYGSHLSTSKAYLYILREDGTVLFSDSLFFLWAQNSMFQPDLIFPTDSGTKMLLQYFDSTSRVYSLPGMLPCFSCSDYLPKPTFVYDYQTFQNDFLKVFPNPNDGEVSIEYNVPDNYKNSEIIIIDINGTEVKKIKLEKLQGTLTISQNNIPSGNYIAYLKTNKGLISSKKIIHIE